MVEFTYNNIQTVQPNTGALLNTSIACPCRMVLHTNERANVTLRGPLTNNRCSYRRYLVTAKCNIAVSEGGTVGEIQVGLVSNGEIIPTSIAAVTPAAVGDYFQVTSSGIIDVPNACCVDVALENVSVAATEGGTPTSIDIRNLSMIIEGGRN